MNTVSLEKRQGLMKSSVNRFYRAIDLEPNDTRKSIQVKARTAIGVALMTWAKNQWEVAEALGRDRSTVAHYGIKHENNLLYWDGYSEMYDTALLITEHRMSQLAIPQKLEKLAEKLALLQSEYTLLKSQLEA